MREQTFYSDEKIMITSNRIIIGQTTYTTSSVVSVSKAVKSYNLRQNTVSIFCLFCIFSMVIPLIISVQSLSSSFPVFISSTLVILAGIVFLCTNTLKKACYLLLTLNNQLITVLESKDEDYVDRVKAAIENAISSRGYYMRY